MSTDDVAPIPVLDIGGTHVTAALVGGGVVLESARAELDARASAERIVGRIAEAAGRLTEVPADATWGIAVPGPFDYEHGIGDFTGVDKFQSLQGFDLGSALVAALPGRPARVTFLNDAEAYALGEWVEFGEPDRVMCITLGTGVGSGFVVAGVPVSTGSTVPPQGNIHTELWHERPIEETVSRDAIRRAFTERGRSEIDVDEIARLARTGDPDARQVLTEAMIALGAVLARWGDRFLPDLVVLGGSISRSWDVLEAGLLYGFGVSAVGAPIVAARSTDEAPLLGAAAYVAQQQAVPSDPAARSAASEKGLQR